MRRTARWCAVTAAMALAVTPATTALADGSATSRAGQGQHTKIAKDRNVPVPAPEDIRTGKFDTLRAPGQAKKAAAQDQAQTQPRAARAAAAGESPPVGTVKTWLALDDTKGYYTKSFQLMGVGDNIEIWVAVSDPDGDGVYTQALTFPAGSKGACRNEVFDGQEVTITQEQVDGFIHEFDTNIYPKESETFSVPENRDGTQLQPTFGAPFNEILDVPADYWAGDGDKIVTLVDNVRDENYYDPSTPDGQTYIAGFFSSLYSDTFDRNMMNIDAFDWLHRTGANPPDDTGSPEATTCPYAGVAPRPHRYEGIFAHEYQHLLMHDEDPDEVNWVNEGLSDWSQTLVGYVDPSTPGTDPTADSHIACFQGFLGENFGGPENSLTEWGDQGGPEILCDYGAAYTMMEYLHGRFGGDAFMTALHREDGNGLVGLQTVIDQFGYDADAQQVVHDWLAMVALDQQLDNGLKLKGGNKSIFTSPTLTSAVNWDSPQAYASPGAPPNGADYVRLRNGAGSYLAGDQVDSLSFSGAGSYEPAPLEWTVQDGRLFSGVGDDLDRGIAREVTVPTDNPVLQATVEWGTELDWDFAFVQVYDEETGDWVSIPDEEGNSTTEHNDSADPAIVGELPGFSGPSPNGDVLSGPKTLTFDLSDYAGQEVAIGFRYMTDGATTGLGYWVDDVTLGGQPVSDGTDLADWGSYEQVRPQPVEGWTVQLVGYGPDTKPARIARLDVTQAADGSFVAAVGKRQLRQWLAGYSVVGAIVTADDPSETAPAYPTYTLTVNGVTQPGGS